MLHADRGHAPAASLVAGDGAALPLRDNASGLTLAMHMLYHVPEPLAAVRELRRITHPAGQVLVVLNGEDHLRELHDLITAALGDITNGEPPLRERLRLARRRRGPAGKRVHLHHPARLHRRTPHPGPSARRRLRAQHDPHPEPARPGGIRRGNQPQRPHW